MAPFVPSVVFLHTDLKIVQVSDRPYGDMPPHSPSYRAGGGLDVACSSFMLSPVPAV